MAICHALPIMHTSTTQELIMKTTVTLHYFREAFRTMGRGDKFTYDGLEVLFDFLEEMESGTGEEYELDVISICCDFCESSPDEVAESYDIDLSECEDDEEKMEAVRQYLDGKTMVVGTTGGSIIYQVF
jgi:hypothetical protein